MFELLFNHLEFFQRITAQEKDIICRSIAYRKVKEGEVLLQAGTFAEETYFICKGVLKMVGIGDNGKEFIHFFFGENQFCTILKSFNKNTPSDSRIQAACDTEIIVFRKDKLHSLHHDLPYSKNLSDKISKQTLRNKIALRHSSIGEDATTRYQKFIQQQSNIAFMVSQTDIAAYLGITKQSLSRIRKKIL